MKTSWRVRWRIVSTIAAKDVLDAIKNKTVLSVVLGMALMVLSAQALPLLIKMGDKDRLVVYDAGGSGRVADWAKDDRLALTQVDSLAELHAFLARLNSEIVGLVIPADLDQRLADGEPLVLEAYVVWSARRAADKLASNAEVHLQALLGRPVEVQVDGHWIYPPADGEGQLGMVGMVLVNVVATMGVFLVPYLIFEEKQGHTMDALLVSPATAGQITLGKALAGLFYCVVAAAVAVALNYTVVVRWDVLLLTVVCGSLVSIAIGLLMGSLFESAQDMGFWAGLPLIFLFAPLLLTGDAKLPAAVATVLPWLPTAVMAENLMLSFTNALAWDTVLPNLAVLIAWSLPLFSMVAWIVRRADR